MTTAEINIWIRTRAKEARVVLQAVKRDLEKLAAAGANAGGVLDALGVASRGYAVNLRTAGAAAASLATALAQINRSGAPAAKHMMNIGVAAELLPPAFRQATISSQGLSATLQRLSISARSAATPLAQLGAAARTLGAVNTISARGVKNIMDLGIAAELAGPAMTQASAAAYRLNTAMTTLTVSTNAAAAAMRAFNIAAGQTAAAASKSAKGTQTAAAASAAAASQMGAASTAAASAAASTATLGNAAGRAGGDVGNLGGALGGAAEGARHLDSGLWNASDKMRKIGSQAQWTGRQLSVMFTAPTLLMVGLGTAWALEYEKAFTRMKKVYNGNLDDMGGAGPEFAGSKFDRFFTALSNRLGHSREDIANVAADLAQAGLEGAQLAKATQLVGEFSILGDQDLEKSTTDLISVMAQYKLSADQMKDAIATLNAISNETPVSMANLTDGFVRTASVAREAGVDVRQLGAFIAALTPAAGTAAVSANGLKSIFTRLMVPTKEAAEVLANIGIDISDPNWISKNAVDRLAELSTKFEGLSQQQKFDLAKPFAGLYQINKFVALMDDMAHATGNYRTALEAAATPEKSMATYQRELNTFLQSNPQKLKIAGSIIKNSLADAIIPLVPHIVWLAQSIAKMTNAFSNLNPVTQKFIIYALLALAAVGPLSMLMGSFAILFGVFGKTLYWVARGFIFLAGPGSKAAGIFRYLGLMARGAVVEMANLAKSMGSLFRFVARGGTAAHTGGFFTRMLSVATSFVAKLWRIIVPAFGRIAPFLLRVVAPRVVAAFGYIAAGLSGPIGWAVAAVITLIMMFPEQSWAVAKSTLQALTWPFVQGIKLGWKALQGLGRIVADAFSGIGEMIIGIMTDGGIPVLARPFVVGVKIIGKTLAALPKIVVEVFKGVVRVIQRAAQAVYEAFSYINPFAHHSPSLVENVTGGMAIVKDEFSKMADAVAVDTRRAYAAISKFGNATAGLKVRAADFEREDRRTNMMKADPSGAAWASYEGLEKEASLLKRRIDEVNESMERQQKVVDGAQEAVDRQEKSIDQMEKSVKSADRAIEGMNKTLDVMRDAADSVQDALQKAQEQLDYYSNAPIKGMRAMSDAIFENEIAQKKLRLEIMKLEDAGQSVDDLADKYANLQGQIETLSGEREGLRQKGAGSDILSVYDQMLSDLQAQQGALATESLSPIAEAQKELERLQREGEKLDLENALKFDPLTRQIDQLVNSTRELSFEQIVAGVTANKGAVDALTVSYEAANTAVKGQEAAIKVAEEARYGLNAAIDLEKDKLDLLNEALDAEQAKLDMVKDAHQELEDTLSAVEEEMNSITSAVDIVNTALDEMARKAEEAAKAAEELDTAWEDAALGDFEVPGGLDSVFDETDIDAMTEELTRQTAEMFDNIDIGGAISGFFQRIGDWFAQLPGRIGGWLADCAVSIGTAIAGWAAGVGGWLAGFGAAISDWFSRMWSEHIWPALQALPGQMMNFFLELPGHVAEGIYYIAGYLGGLLVKGIVGALVGLGMIGFKIGEAIGNGIAWVIKEFPGWMESLGSAVSSAMGWIVTLIADHAEEWLMFLLTLPGRMLKIGQDIFGKLIDAAVNAFGWLRDNLPGLIEEWLTFLINLPGRMLELGVNIMQGLLDGIWSIAQGVGSWINEHMIQPLLKGFKDALGIHSPSTVFADFGVNLIEGLWEGIKSMGSKFKDLLIGWVKDHVPGPVADVLGIKSPSRVFMGFGRNIAEGLAIGIVSGTGDVDAAASSLANAAADATAIMPPAQATNPLAGTEKVYAAAFANISTNAAGALAGMYVGMEGQNLSYTSTALATYTTFGAATTAQFTTLSTSAQAVASAMKDGLLATTDATTRGMSDSFKAGHDAVASTTQSMTETATSNFQSLATNLNTIMSEQIVPMFDSFNPALGAVAGWFEDSVGTIGNTWAGIKEPVAVPARFIINDVYNDGIRGAWNSFNNFLGVDALPEHIAKFATGGAIHGAGDGRSDSILARVANNEHVVTAKEVRGAGGHAAVEATRKMWAAGKLPAFAKGGPVDLNAAPWGGGGGESNLQPAAILARRNIHKYWPEVGTIGGYRAQDAYPDHPSGLALDVMTGDPAGTEINDWLHREKDALALNYTIWKQFYKPAGGIGNLMEDRGSVTQNHYDHVHALFNANGVAGIAAGGVGTLPMDQVVRDAINARMDAIRDRAPQLAGGIGQWPTKSVEKARNQLLDYMVPKALEMAKSTSGSGMIGNAESWRPMAMEAMKRQGFAWQNKAQVDAMLAQIMTESTGDPSAIQKVIDVNSGGNEAAGLLQIIPTTWAAHRDPELPDNRLDPWANMNGALRYYKSRYGMDLTTMWGKGHGYDNGGLLQPTPDGYGTYYNHTGKPEAVLTDQQWNGIYDAAQVAQSAEVVQIGVTAALEDVYGTNPARAAAEEQAKAMQDANGEWTPALYDAAAKQVSASNSTAKAAEKTKTGVEKFVEVGTKINTAVQDFSTLMLAIAAAMQQSQAANGQVTFGMVAPVLNALGSMIEKMPDAEPEYVSWAGTTQPVTAEMRRQKLANDAANIAKGSYMLFKSVAPMLLKHTASIGTAIESLITSNMPLVTAAIAMFPTNPVGAAIMLIPVLLQAIFTILPMIIQAILDIVPAMIRSLYNLFTKFMPDSVYAYDSLEAAEKAATQNEDAIRQGASGPNFEKPVSQQYNSNAPVTIHVASVTVEAKDQNSADQFVSNLQVLAGN